MANRQVPNNTWKESQHWSPWEQELKPQGNIIACTLKWMWLKTEHTSFDLWRAGETNTSWADDGNGKCHSHWHRLASPPKDKYKLSMWLSSPLLGTHQGERETWPHKLTSPCLKSLGWNFWVFMRFFLIFTRLYHMTIPKVCTLKCFKIQKFWAFSTLCISDFEFSG